MNNIQPWVVLPSTFYVLAGEYVGRFITERESSALGLVACEADGRQLPVDEYPELYALIGGAYNIGPVEAGKFMIPDCRGLVAQTGGTAVRQITSQEEIDSHDHGRRI